VKKTTLPFCRLLPSLLRQQLLLEKGNHTVVFKSTLSLPFAQDVTYNIIAE
jgi:hypothetical protein